MSYGIHMTTTPNPGELANHLRNGKVLRRVRILEVGATEALVEAVNGPIAGCRYSVALEDLGR